MKVIWNGSIDEMSVSPTIEMPKMPRFLESRYRDGFDELEGKEE